MKQFEPRILGQLRGYARQTDAKILVANPFEFIMKCGNLDAANAAVEKFSNAATGTIGYGEPTQVKFEPC